MGTDWIFTQLENAKSENEKLLRQVDRLTKLVRDVAEQQAYTDNWWEQELEDIYNEK